MEYEKIWLTPIIVYLCLFIVSCASSNVSRDVASGMDLGVHNANHLVTNLDGKTFADTYQNYSQATKGAILGGATGAVAGTFASGVGTLPGTITGAILGASYGSYIDANTSLQDRLINRGANIIVLGDQILIAIPSDRLFKPWTDTIKPQAYSTLYLIAQFINQYVNTLVKVSIYTNDTGSSRIDLALSQSEARAFEKALIESGLNTRLLYVEGFGGTHQVVQNSLDWESDNYRVEITLEKLYV